MTPLFFLLCLLVTAYVARWLWALRNVGVVQSMTLSAQTQAMRGVSWLVATAFHQASGLASVEVCLRDARGHEVLVEVFDPKVGSVGSGTTVGDFCRIVTPTDEASANFAVTSARFVVVYDGQRYVMHFSQPQLTTLMGVVLDSARNISVNPAIANETLRGEPVRAQMHMHGSCTQHDVLPAVARLIGPKSCWWAGVNYQVSGEAMLRESLRQVHGLRCTNHFYKNYLGLFYIKVKYAGDQDWRWIDYKLLNVSPLLTAAEST